MSGVLPVRAECLPFTHIPHSTPLFLDFLYNFSKVRRFYPRTPYQRDWWAQQAAEIQYPRPRREQVAAILERQNRAFGSSLAALEAIARFREGAAVVVTGQQAVLFGGPLFAIFKALTAAKLAREASAAGVPTVPVFWIASEDHDLAEVNHTTILDAGGSPHLLLAATRGSAGAPVGDVQFGPEIEALSAQAAALLGESDATEALRAAYRPGQSMSSAFAKLMARLLAEYGIVLIDPADAELHRLAEPVYRGAISRSAELVGALVERGRELQAAGYHEQVKVTKSSVLLFLKQDGARTVIHRTNGAFVAGERKMTEAELLQRLAQAPEDFSANVLLRPVTQDYLLPTLAYSGGPAEVAYFAQADVVYQQLLGRRTPVIHRFSGTIVDPRAQRLLKQYGLGLVEIFDGPERVRQLLALRHLPAELQARFDETNQVLGEEMEAVRGLLEKLDASLVDAAARAESKMLYQLRRLRGRAAGAELRRSHDVSRHAQALSGSLYPEKELQERRIAGIYYAARYGAQVLQEIFEAMQPNCPDHQLLYL